MIVLRSPVRSLTVHIGSRALHESAAMLAKAKANTLGRLRLTVITRNAAGRQATIHVGVKP